MCSAALQGGDDMNRSILGGMVAVLLLLIGIVAWRAGTFATGDGTGQPAPVPVTREATPVQPQAAPEPEPEPVTPAPSFDVVRIEADGTAVLAGRAAPGAEVTIHDGERVVGTVTADSRGEWVLLPQEALPSGARELRVEARNPDGTQMVGADSVVLVVPEPKRDIAGRRQEQTGGALAVLTPEEGAPRVLQAPPTDGTAGSTPSPGGVVAVDAINYDRDGRVSVGGRAAAGREVMVYLDNTLVGRATADDQGRWELTPDQPVQAGQRSLRIDQLGPDGKVSGRAEVAFDRREIGETALGGRAVVVLPGNNLWTIARRSFGGGPQYTMIFEANQGQIRDPDLIYPGQIFILPGGQAGH